MNGNAGGALAVQAEQQATPMERAFALLQRQAKALSEASLVPKEFQRNIANCMIAVEMAHRIGASPLMVAQNLYVVRGKPSWSSQFVISAINSTKKFSPLRFEMKGKEGTMERSCTAWAKDLESGERLESPTVSMQMAKAEGWIDKDGSKWKTMPELMLRYRSATFFGRLYAPELLMGMRTTEESEDVEIMERATVTAASINAALSDTPPPNNQTFVDEAEVPNEEADSSPSEDADPVKPEIVPVDWYARIGKAENEAHLLLVLDDARNAGLEQTLFDDIEIAIDDKRNQLKDQPKKRGSK